jgi:copper transport outer membrane protein MctB
LAGIQQNMIDFRYHLVSLISVFLALAVGIVLGAGPLKDSLGTQLTERVESLRAEKDVLRADLDTASTGVEHRDTFVSTVTPSLLSGQLTGRSVVILSLPGVDNDDADPVVDGITAAGGKVTGRISISGTWIDPQLAESREKTITKLATHLPTGAPVGSDNNDARLGYLLAGAVVSTGAGAVGQSTGANSTVLDGLRSADLIEVKGDVSGLAGGALVLAPAMPQDNRNAARGTPWPGATSPFVDLAVALDTVGGGAVVTGPASSATDGGVLTAVRKNDEAKSRVSTVDTGSTPMGVITAVLAIREQLSGSAGHYGFGSGVTDPMPTLAAAAGATVSPSAPKK